MSDSSATLPFGIEVEYLAAVEKTGETERLRTARQRITYLLRMGPHRVEVETAQLYQRMK